MKNKNNNAENRYTIQVQVDNYMDIVVKYLNDRYGEVKREWNAALEMLSTQYLIYLKCREKVLTEGVMVVNPRGGFDKHPLLKQITDSQIQIVKLINEFGLSPKSEARIKVGTGQDNEDDYIKSLTEGDE